jgi:hypothetical protein
MLLVQVWTHSGLNWYFLSKPKFCYFFEFLVTKSIQKSISSTPLSSENSEINFIKFDSPWAFQQHQERLQIPIKFSVLILFSFHWKNDSTIVASTPQLQTVSN